MSINDNCNQKKCRCHDVHAEEHCGAKDVLEMNQARCPYMLDRYQDESKAVTDALRVLTWSPETRKWLRAHDPKALEQADAALKAINANPACGWDEMDK